MRFITEGIVSMEVELGSRQSLIMLCLAVTV